MPIYIMYNERSKKVYLSIQVGIKIRSSYISILLDLKLFVFHNFSSFILDIREGSIIHVLPTEIMGFHGAVLRSMILGCTMMTHLCQNVQMKHVLSMIAQLALIG